VSSTDEARKRRQVWRRAESKSDAKELTKQLIHDIDEYGETVPTGDRITLDQYLDHWLRAAAKPRLSVRTDYDEMLARYIRPAVGRKMLSNVRPLDIQSL
jgi:hypothetical protein